MAVPTTTMIPNILDESNENIYKAALNHIKDLQAKLKEKEQANGALDRPIDRLAIEIMKELMNPAYSLNWDALAQEAYRLAGAMRNEAMKY